MMIVCFTRDSLGSRATPTSSRSCARAAREDRAGGRPPPPTARCARRRRVRGSASGNSSATISSGRAWARAREPQVRVQDGRASSSPTSSASDRRAGVEFAGLGLAPSAHDHVRRAASSSAIRASSVLAQALRRETGLVEERPGEAHPVRGALELTHERRRLEQDGPEGRHRRARRAARRSASRRGRRPGGRENSRSKTSARERKPSGKRRPERHLDVRVVPLGERQRQPGAAQRPLPGRA